MTMRPTVRTPSTLASRVGTALTLALLSTSAAAQTDDGLRIYLIDVEGGNATLFVSPEGESLLIDTGNGGENADRDVGRMMAAAEDAGLEQIDHLITTHWHADLWQLYFSQLSDQDYTVPGVSIANLIDEQAPMPPPARATEPPRPVHNGPA